MEGDTTPPSMRVLAVVWTLVGLGLVAWGVLTVFREPIHFLLAPILLATILVYLFSPLVDRLARMGLHRVLATGITYVAALGVLALLGWTLVPLLSRQFVALIDGLPDILIGVREALERLLEPLGLAGLIPAPADGQDTGDWVASLVQGNGDQVVGLLATVRALLGSLVSGVLGLLLAPVLAFYLLADLPRVATGIQRLIPPAQRGEVMDVGRRILSTVGAYFRGQLLVATFVGVATAIGLGILGLPFWALIGAATGLFNLVPFVGPVLGGVIGVVVALTVGGGLTQALVVVAIMVAVQQLDNHVITPSILARTVHVHPVTIILSLIVAATMFGIIGMLVAIPTVAAIKLITLYVLATRVPAMAHLADPDQFLDGVPLPPARPGSVAVLSQQLRAIRDRRRSQPPDPSG